MAPISKLIGAIIGSLTAASTVLAISISEYYYGECDTPVNTYFSGSILTYWNTHTGISIGWTETEACSLWIYSDRNCDDPVEELSAADDGHVYLAYLAEGMIKRGFR
ncbi:hypothetical protein M406DRAFT_75084 [Cryphonectria parasitica EP155]|uniref:Uncharacterized protein n=1 Tax=Cryphonectria parasitica (strain ATCC 38755 / EP155) TaxID=660469 RepID=A0A9P5CN78_CRYP1|nr:uncharacterized protein M406DRAFT_75084 [Cryphonectria parasitica EP155]KAF3763851.1 hypothetical protein M406DRAFT_75084 [Cryphonectria parasitica EP155]